MVNKVLKLSPARSTEVILKYGDIQLTRFANNAITQSVAENNLRVAIRVLHQGKMGRAETNKTDPDSLTNCCEQALHLAKFSSPDPQSLPLPGRQNYEASHSFFDSTQACNAAMRARQISDMAARAKSQSATLAGAHKISLSSTSIGNSQGLFAYNKSSEATISVTANRNGATGASHANANNVQQIQPEALVDSAIHKALLSEKTIAMPSGDYTVILEPLAVLNLLSSMVIDYISHVCPFSGTALQNKLGFAVDRLGKQIFSQNLTIDDDAYHPLHQGAPFDGEGMPRMPVILIYQGILTQLVHSRASALHFGEQSTGHALELPNPYGAVPLHLVMHGGNSTLDEMIAKTKKGLYITRFWYNRMVDPTHLLLTGMTRDGTFMIEDGKIVCGVKNMRFNESLFSTFQHITELGESVRTYDEESGRIMVVPPIRVEGFHFSGPALR